ncbi:hypothetical protein [Phaeobacter phage MD18]|nr:hypothetical protein [Phaeobacter phage MD18]
MGTSTDGILAYGVALHDYDELPYEELPFANGTESFEELIHQLAGLPAYGEEGHSFDKQREAEEAFPLELVRHCSGDYPNWILAVRGTVKTANRGYPEALGGSLPDIPNAGVEVLNEWCEKYDIEKVLDWYLCSDWF